MTPEELAAIRERHRKVAESVPGITLNHHGLLAHHDRYNLLAEVDRLTALTKDIFWVTLTQHEAEVARLNGEIDDWRIAFNDLSARYLATGTSGEATASEDHRNPTGHSPTG